ncbi:MAG: tetratricopeptide repeat protein, partial [Megasphaera micronuciformis]|nr:tetratricopeptide repeat protein [Megasphaera micronuciformis]
AYGRFNYDRAVDLYSQALAIDENDYTALSGAGIALAMRGNATGSQSDIQEGIRKIEKALTVNPDDTASFYNLALAYKIAGRTDEAVTWFQKVIDKDPQNTWSYYGIASIYGDRGNAEKAVEYLQKAMDTDEENVRNAAASQSHFDAVRNDSRFRKLIYKE